MAIARARLVLPVQDPEGNLIENISVRVYEPRTTTLIAEPVFVAESGNTEPAAPAFFADGVIDLYMALPKRVRIGVQPEGQSEFYLENREFLPAGNNLVLAEQVLQVTGVPAAGKVLTGLSATAASWQVVAAPSGGGGGSSEGVGGFSPNALFGLGEEGDLTLPSGLTTFDQNHNFANLHIPEDAILDPGGYIVVVSGVLSGSGVITASGDDAVGSSRGAGYVGYSMNGRNGGQFGGQGGGNGSTSGGNGGAGSSQSGGPGGVHDLGGAFRGGIFVDTVAIIAEYNYGGSGGGSGGAGDTDPGGAGGGGAGAIWLAARTNAFTGTIKADGGRGADGVNPNSGGGGGGGGGTVVFITAAGIELATVTANGGLGGAGNGTGEAGQPGEVGHVGAYSVGIGSDTPVDVTVNPPAPGGGGTGTGFHAGTGLHSVIGGDLDVDGVAAGEDAIAIGNGSQALTDSSIAVGGIASGEAAIAIGSGTNASGDHALAHGTGATASGVDSVAEGYAAQAAGQRSVAVGATAYVAEDDHGVIKVDTFEIFPSSPGGLATATILHDSAGVRWQITVDTTGHLTTTAL